MTFRKIIPQTIKNQSNYFIHRLDKGVFIMGEESEDDYGEAASLPPVKRIRVTQMDLLNHLLNEVCVCFMSLTVH